jgi:hypothetical protein
MENHEKINSDKRCPVEFRTEHLLNTSLEHFRYTSLLGEEIIDSSILMLSPLLYGVCKLGTAVAHISQILKKNAVRNVSCMYQPPVYVTSNLVMRPARKCSLGRLTPTSLYETVCGTSRNKNS